MLEIFVVLALLLLGVIVIIARQPAEFRVTRSARINAPPAKVFDYANNLQNWNSWSPWAKLDPNAKYAYEGPQAGPGAVIKWDGDNKVGAGIMTITDIKPNDLIRMRLEFLRPFKGTNTVEFAFKPEGSATHMTWSMYGKNTFISKCMGLFMSCDKMMSKFFDEGLQTLNTAIQNQPHKAA